MKPIITFDESAVNNVLKAVGCELDREGYVIDSESGTRETTEFGDEITKEHFTGVEHGSLIFLDDDFNTLVNHVKRRRKG